MTTQATAILQFYQQLRPRFGMPEGIEIMNPYAEKETWAVVKQFYKKYYSDKRPRTLVFGINPGRFGAGVTGVPFTDPLRLETACGIANPWKKQYELSSIFVYQVIEAFGGVEAFYDKFFITALSPLGFTWNGKNLNYYDDKPLLKAAEPFILDCIRKQIDALQSPPVVFCLGEGENYKQFRRLDDQHHFFKEIIPLPHPRWVMQYRRKRAGEYAAMYVEKLNAVL